VISFLNSYLSSGEFGILKIIRHEHYSVLSNFFRKNQISLNQEIAEGLLKIISSSQNLEVENFKPFYKYFEIIDFLFRKYLKTGGYPLAVEKEIKGEEMPMDLIIKDTLGTIEKEGLSAEILNRLLPQISNSLTSKMSYSKLAKELAIVKKEKEKSIFS